MYEMTKCKHFKINSVDSIYCFSCEKMNMEFISFDKCYYCKSYERVKE